jgi:hypothetical protein
MGELQVYVCRVIIVSKQQPAIVHEQQLDSMSREFQGNLKSSH